jgi:hypothetical protein
VWKRSIPRRVAAAGCATIRAMFLARTCPVLLVVGVGASLLTPGCNDSPQGGCEAGRDGCPCAAGGVCEAGAQCVQGWCQAAPDATGGTTTGMMGSTSTVPTGSASEVSGGTATAGSTGADGTSGGTGEPTKPEYRWHTVVEPGEARDVDVTPAGELAVVGYVERAMYDRDAWLGLFDGTGAPLWERTLDGEDGAGDEFNAVAIDGAGNITATGKQDLLVGWDDVLTVTWDAQGAELQKRGYGNEFKRDDVGYGTAVDAAGNVYVCGYFTYMDDFVGNGLAYTTRYADYSGTDWLKYTGLLEDVQYDCETGPLGYLITAGVRGSFASIQRFAADGDSVYRVEYDVLGAGSTVARGVMVDPADESVVVVGYATLPTGTTQWVGRWDFAGDKLWVTESVGAGGQLQAQDVVLDADGWLRVVGSDKIDGTWSVVITTFDSEGVERDRATWSMGQEHLRALGVATREDSLYVVGGTGDALDQAEVLIAEFGV